MTLRALYHHASTAAIFCVAVLGITTALGPERGRVLVPHIPLKTLVKLKDFIILKILL